MTAKDISKTETVGVAASAFNAETVFTGPTAGAGTLTIVNLSTSAIVGVAWNGVTAAIYGDDTRHIGPMGYLEVPYPNGGILSLISDTAATKVEIANGAA